MVIKGYKSLEAKTEKVKRYIIVVCQLVVAAHLFGKKIVKRDKKVVYSWIVQIFRLTPSLIKIQITHIDNTKR